MLLQVVTVVSEQGLWGAHNCMRRSKRYDAKTRMQKCGLELIEAERHLMRGAMRTSRGIHIIWNFFLPPERATQISRLGGGRGLLRRRGHELGRERGGAAMSPT